MGMQERAKERQFLKKEMTIKNQAKVIKELWSELQALKRVLIDHRISITGHNEKMEEDELLSDCCGAFTTDTEMGICPDCLEHCEFTTSEE